MSPRTAGFRPVPDTAWCLLCVREPPSAVTEEGVTAFGGSCSASG